MTNRLTLGADRSPWIALGLLMAVTFIAYLPALDAGYIWDDDDYVTRNEVLRTSDGLARIWFEPSSIPQYYPLVHTSFWIEYRLWQLDPQGYHLVNIVLHGLSAFLLYLLLRKLKVPVPLLAAAVFALHPVHVESVAWITERKNVLAGVFYLLAMLAFLRWRPLDDSGKGSNRYYALCILAFLCALFSKTVTCSFPAVLLLLIWWKRGRIAKADLLATAPMFVLGFALAMVTATMEVEHVLAKGSDWELSFIERSLIAGRALWFYAAKLVWPFHLSFNYARWEIDSSAAWQYVYPITALGVMTLLFFMRKVWGRGPLTAVLIFAGGLVPALGFFNVYPMVYSFVADHFQYLPSIALIVLLCGLMARVLKRLLGENAQAPSLIALILLAGLGTLTYRQARIYENIETLWTDTIEKNPDSWLALGNLGGVRLNQGRLDEARGMIEESLRIRDPNPYAHNNLGMILLEKGEVTKAKAQFEIALEQRSDYAEVHNNMAVLLWRQDDLVTAVDHLEKAVELYPEYPDAHRNLGEIYALQGHMEEAATHLEKAASVYRHDPGLRFAAAEAYREAGNHRRAKVHYQAVRGMDPRFIPAYINEAKCLKAMGSGPHAMTLLAAVLKREPGNDEAWSLLVNYLVDEDPDRRLIEATNACSYLRKREPALLDAVAAELARAGRFEEAAQAESRAVELAGRHNQWEDEAAFRRRLKSYLEQQ